MIELTTIGQPSKNTTLDALESSVQGKDVRRITSAVAYVTTSGLQSLERRCLDLLGTTGPANGERWLTSFDYLRTEPVALQVLRSRPKALVRIYDADACISRRGNPKTPFHPKLFLIEAARQSTLIVGSGNLSYSGLTRGVEAGLVVTATPDGKANGSKQSPMVEMSTWFDHLWAMAEELDDNLYARYLELYDSEENLLLPAPTEDDISTGSLGRKSSFTVMDLQRLRMCRHFWIDAGNITKNLGDDRPGNQLMMKRLSRVYFGIPQDAVPQNSPLDSVDIFYNDVLYRGSLTFSDNGMDKLTLPIPGRGGPASYDGETLLFTRVGTRSFLLATGSASQKVEWRTKSEGIQAKFKMKRQGNSLERYFGVF